MVNQMPVMLDGKATIALLQHLHLDAGVAGPVPGWQQLQGAQLVLDGVVPGHLTGVFEAEDPFRMQRGVQGPIGGLGLLGRDGQLAVEAGEEVPQHGVGLVDGDGPRQPEFADQPVLEGAGHALHPALGLWRTGKELLDAQFPHGPGELGRSHGLGKCRGLPLNLKTPWRSP